MHNDDYNRVRADFEADAYPKRIRILEMRVRQTGYMTMIFSDEINQQFFQSMQGLAPFDLVGPAVEPMDPPNTITSGNMSHRSLQSNVTKEEDQTVRDLRFSWVIGRSSKTAVELKLNFTNPIDVSRLTEGPDEMNVTFTPN